MGDAENSGSDVLVKKTSFEKISRHDNLLQTGFWGEFKSLFGWKPYAFLVDLPGLDTKNIPLLVLSRELPGGYSLAYIPHGPDLDTIGNKTILDNKAEFTALLMEFSKAISPFLSEKCVFLRFDLPVDKSEKFHFFDNPVKKAPMDIQPPDTVILDLSETEDEILKQMKKKTRYNIRLCFKKGTEILIGNRDNIDEWYDLYRTTAERDKITLHKREYYKTLFDLAEKYRGNYPSFRILLAKINSRIEAGIIISIQGKKAVYLYGASSNNNRDYMPAYGLQWEAIKMAKKEGCLSYDFFGIPPSNNPGHPMHGLYRFKTGFGGRIVRRYGSADIPLRTGLYRGYRLAEGIRKFYYKKIRKK